jgi:uncharacterized membrane protein
MSQVEPRSMLERRLAQILSYGTWLASGVIAAGLTLAATAWPGIGRFSGGMPLVTAGIALFILLPVVRVALMLVFFLRDRDYVFSAAAALVLLIMAIGCVLGSG